MKVFAYCKCFYEQNIFIRRWNKHVTFKDEDQFLKEYQGEASLADALAEAKGEVERRIDARRSCLQRREDISKNYSSSFNLDPQNAFKKDFLEASKWSAEHSEVSGLPPNVAKIWKEVYSVPVFSEDFCQKFTSELERFKNSGLAHSQPNSMNRNGVLIDELQFFDNFFDDFRSKLAPIFKKLFPDFSSPDVSFDSHKAFVVDYSLQDATGDVELAEHFDNAEITINVSLTKNHEGGELVFNDGQRFGIVHDLGIGIIHLGSLLHQAMPISSGQRSNLIVWVRSSDVRNRRCPMCLHVPDLIPASAGSTGDGFTLSDDDQKSSVCTVA